LFSKTFPYFTGEDAQPDMEQNPFTLNEAKNENLYIDDPKKALKGFFEREGLPTAVPCLIILSFHSQVTICPSMNLWIAHVGGTLVVLSKL
jgi:hypothetical protein